MNKLKILQFSIGPIGSAVVGLATLPIMAWFFSTEDIGRFAMLQVITSISMVILTLGLDQAYIREYHETEKKPELLKSAITPGLLCLAIITIATTAIDNNFFSKLLFSLEDKDTNAAILLCIFTSFTIRFLATTLRMQEKGLAFSTSQVLPKLLFFIIIICLATTSKIHNFQALITSQAIALLATTFFLTQQTWNTIKNSIKKSTEFYKIKKMLEFGYPLMVGGVAYCLLITTDKILLRELSTFEQLGIYSMASGIASAVGIFTSIFTTIWSPTIYKWIAEGASTEKITQTSEHILAAAFFIFILSGIFSWLAPHLLPNDYSNIQYLVTLCVSAPLIYAISETTSLGINISRKTSFSMAASAIAATTNIAGCYILIPNHGATGAAISTAYSFYIFLIIRTELSCIAWKKIPRSKTYISMLLCVSLSTLTLIINIKNPVTPIACWLALGAIGCLLFKKSIKLAITNGTSKTLKGYTHKNS